LKEIKENKNKPKEVKVDNANHKIQRRNLKQHEKENKKLKLEQKLKELEELERIVKQKEQLRKARLWAVLIIQKWTRGHQCRKRFELIRKNVTYIRKLRRMLSVAIKKLQNKFSKQLIYSMNKCGKILFQKKKDVMNRLLNHSAMTIQKFWKGHRIRRYVLPEVFKENRIKSIIVAFIRGWKVRKIMK